MSDSDTSTTGYMEDDCKNYDDASNSSFTGDMLTPNQTNNDKRRPDVKYRTAQQWQMVLDPNNQWMEIYSEDKVFASLLLCRLCKKHCAKLKKLRNYSDTFVVGICGKSIKKDNAMKHQKSNQHLFALMLEASETDLDEDSFVSLKKSDDNLNGLQNNSDHLERNYYDDYSHSSSLDSSSEVASGNIQYLKYENKLVEHKAKMNLIKEDLQMRRAEFNMKKLEHEKKLKLLQDLYDKVNVNNDSELLSTALNIANSTHLE